MQKNKLNLRICGMHLLNPYKTVVSHLKKAIKMFLFSEAFSIINLDNIFAHLEY